MYELKTKLNGCLEDGDRCPLEGCVGHLSNATVANSSHRSRLQLDDDVIAIFQCSEEHLVFLHAQPRGYEA